MAVEIVPAQLGSALAHLWRVRPGWYPACPSCEWVGRRGRRREPAVARAWSHYVSTGHPAEVLTVDGAVVLGWLRQALGGGGPEIMTWCQWLRAHRDRLPSEPLTVGQLLESPR